MRVYNSSPVAMRICHCLQTVLEREGRQTIEIVVNKMLTAILVGRQYFYKFDIMQSMFTVLFYRSEMGVWYETKE